MRAMLLLPVLLALVSSAHASGDHRRMVAVTKSRFRVEQEGGAELEDCAEEVRFTVRMVSKVAVQCNVTSTLEEYPYCLAVFVNGKQQPDICPTTGEQQLYTVAEDLSFHEIYTVRLVKNNETGSILVTNLEVDDWTFVHFDAPNPTTPKMLFVGASITAGFWNSGRHRTVVTKAWPWLLCEQFEADCIIFAASGLGLVDKPYYDRIYDEYFTGRLVRTDVTEFVADVVFFNLGTNDNRALVGDTAVQTQPERWVKNVKDIIYRVRSFARSDLVVNMMCGPMSASYCHLLGNATAELREEHFTAVNDYLELHSLGPYTRDFGYHPSAGNETEYLAEQMTDAWFSEGTAGYEVVNAPRTQGWKWW